MALPEEGTGDHSEEEEGAQEEGGTVSSIGLCALGGRLDGGWGRRRGGGEEEEEDEEEKEKEKKKNKKKEEKEKEEEAPRPMPSILQDLESQESMVAFLTSAVASADGEQARLRGQLKEQRLRCRCLAHLLAWAQKQPEAAAPAPGTGMDSVWGGTHQALQGAMEKLQSCFMQLMQEKVDLKERVEELEHRCIQLSGETDTIRVYTALSQPGGSAEGAAPTGGGAHPQASPGQGGDEGRVWSFSARGGAAGRVQVQAWQLNTLSSR
ncbi:golgin subfamily A member 2 [Pan paniscus]|uniref:golgin subfamily A member 2 n=1 Tax=Pan paniscus TaxID=9597 RepID=UPI0030078149